jgi:hypothetical protein
MASAASHRAPSLLWSAPAARRVNWPGGRWQRWAARLLFAAPLVALALWAHHLGFVNAGLALLERRSELARAGGPGLRGLSFGYPPLPVLLALVLPGGTLALAIVTCLCSGITLQFVTERLIGRVSLATTVALVATLVAVPAMWYAASVLLAPMLALTMLAVALDGFVRFAAYGQTEGGFTAGIALALSFCFDPGALLYGAVMCAFVPLVSHARYQEDRAAFAGITAVLLFPLAAVAGSWLFLVWKFTGTVPGSLDYQVGAHVLAFPGGVAGRLGAAGITAATDLAHVPVYLAAAALLFARQRAAALGLLLPVAALAAALWLGFAYSGVTAYFMFTLLALVIIASSAPRRFQPVLIAAAVGQVALAIAWPPTAPQFAAWLHTVL